MDLEAEYELADNVVAQDVSGEAVLLNLENGSYYGLNPVAAQMLDLLRQGLTPSAVCDRVNGQYDVARETLESDLVELCQTLVREKLLKLRA